MNDFFYLLPVGIGPTPVAYGDYDLERDRTLAQGGRLESWSGLTLSVSDGSPTDYLANNLGVRLCSPRLRMVLDNKRGPDDDLEWLDASVTDAEDRNLDYFILRFPTYPDLLDPQRTIWVDEQFVVKPVLSRAKLAGEQVFAFPGATTGTIVADTVKRAIDSAQCTGVEFEPVAMA